MAPKNWALAEFCGAKKLGIGGVVLAPKGFWRQIIGGVFLALIIDANPERSGNTIRFFFAKSNWR